MSPRVLRGGVDTPAAQRRQRRRRIIKLYWHNSAEQRYLQPSFLLNVVYYRTKLGQQPSLVKRAMLIYLL